MMTYLLLWISLSEGSLSPQLRKMSDTPALRVRLAKSVKQVEIAGENIKRSTFLDQQAKNFQGHKTIQFLCEAKNTVDPGRLLASLTSDAGLLNFKEHKYSGRILLASDQLGQRCDVINEVPIEVYISSLLSKEMNSSWHLEALKAQAVAARTYAFSKIYVSNKQKSFDLESSEKDQVSGSLQDVTSRTAQAALATKGEILVGPDGELHPAFFHASCGGETYLPKNVWGSNVTGYEKAKCKHCEKRFTWQYKIENEEADQFLNWLVKKGFVKGSNYSTWRIIPSEFNQSQFRVYLGDTQYRLPKALLRRYFGRVKIGSNNFKIEIARGSTLNIFGRGLGHGVGMCQLGAKRSAEDGLSYKQILAHYYPGFKLEKVY